jgi:hypothetical protein
MPARGKTNRLMTAGDRTPEAERWLYTGKNSKTLFLTKMLMANMLLKFFGPSW